MNGESTNAVAGPSTTRTSLLSSSTPHLFLPPPAPPQTHPVHLSSTQDLLAQFYLLPAYDKYVRPFAAPGETGLDQMTPVPPNSGVNGGLDKGKGKEVETPHNTGVAEGAEGDDDEGHGGKGERKKKNNYKHLIKGVPGKHSLKKDDYLSTTMQVPPKQRIPIIPFDLKTQRDAFTVSLEGLKGWNPSALVLESAQAREDRKKRKELKRLAKLQQAQAQSVPAVTSTQHIQAPIPTPAASSSSFNRPPISEPVHNGTPRPGSTVSGPGGLTVPRPGSTVSKLVASVPGTGSAVPRPGSTVPRPGSTVPRPGSTKPVLPPVKVGTPLRANATGPGTPLRSAGTATPTSAVQNPYAYSVDQDKRGKKRDREDGVVANGISNVNVNGGIHLAQAGLPPKPVINAKAGAAGIRPRPVKKQRMDIQGQARDVTVTQQPTPQGV